VLFLLTICSIFSNDVTFIVLAFCVCLQDKQYAISAYYYNLIKGNEKFVE
jgi:hypothetical protein